MYSARTGFGVKAGGRRYTILYAELACAWLLTHVHSVGPHAAVAWGHHRGHLQHEIDRILCRFCCDWRSGRLCHRANRRAMVPDHEPSGVPCLFLLYVLGRLAACRSPDLNTGSLRHSLSLVGTTGAASGFPHSRRRETRPEAKEDPMTDPRFTDPRYSDPRLSDPVLRRDESAGGMWGWIAGVAVLLLIGFLIIAGWNNNSNTARNGSPTTTTSSAPSTAPARSTTGSGSGAPQPITPAQPPMTPAPSKSSNQ